MRVLHVLKQFPCGGGMETVAKIHINDGDAVLAVTGDASTGSFYSLNGNPWKPIRALKKELKTFINQAEGSFDCTLFYNGYGVEWLDNDSFFGRKYLYLHTDYPQLTKWLTRTLRYVDGFIVVNPALVAKIRKEIPFLPMNRLHVLPYPVRVPESVFNGRKSLRDQIVIGYSGRIQWRQKRLDRLVKLKESLDRSGLNYRFEFLGDGPAKQELVQYFQGDHRWIFHGHLEAEAYWDVLSRWKYQVFLSDYEGLPISLLEGVAAGAVPIYPQIFDEGDFVAAVDEQLQYPFGEVEHIASIIEKVELWKTEEWNRFWQRTEDMIGPHLGEGYEKAYGQFFEKLDEQPRRKKNYPPAYGSWMPLWMYHRIQHKLQFGAFKPPKFRGVKK